MSLYSETLTGLAESETLSMRGDSMHENRPPARLRPVGDYAPEGRAYALERRLGSQGNGLKIIMFYGIPIRSFPFLGSQTGNQIEFFRISKKCPADPGD